MSDAREEARRIARHHIRELPGAEYDAEMETLFVDIERYGRAEWKRGMGEAARVVDAARELTSDSDDIVWRRTDGGENKLAVGFANLRAALKALDELEGKVHEAN